MYVASYKYNVFVIYRKKPLIKFLKNNIVDESGMNG